MREAFEETGILVGLRADECEPATALEDEDIDALRNALVADEVAFELVLDRMACRIAGDSVEYLAHWITPLPEPRRYDTRFFAAKVRDDAESIVDRREMTDAVWIGPAAALRRNRNGTLPLVFPTIKTLEQLAACASTDEALTGLSCQKIRWIMPTLIVTPTGFGMDLREDAP